MRRAVLGAAAVLWACGPAGTVASGKPDGGSGSIGASDAGVDGGAADGGSQDAGSDAGSDAGPDGPDCLGVVPADAGAALTFTIAVSSGSTCGSVTSDGHGTMAAEIVAQGSSPIVDEYDARGTQTGSFNAAGIWPQASGFIGFFASSSGRETVALWDEGGSMTAGSAPFDPGTLVAGASGDGALAIASTSAALTLHLFDANVVETASVTAAVSGGPLPAVAAAQDAGGAVLGLVKAGSLIRGVWFDVASGTGGALFDVGTASDALARPLAGGGIALRLDGHWAYVLQPVSATLHPAPSWLSDGSDFTLVRGGRAYAASTAASALDLISTQGNLCGSLAFHGSGNLAVGKDGTVIQSSGAQGCTKVFWPALLK